ncbi:hypothetical protein [Xenococcus sp. PCC 7305]|uniref:hypothetical protein n=1 Tax=Xenococcus sp. PCC 7305 TaxID=102125 RepID=UPI0002FCCEB7|nr:hypothetical protein [Xenococcus sp. PCC 7305]
MIIEERTYQEDKDKESRSPQRRIIIANSAQSMIKALKLLGDWISGKSADSQHQFSGNQ